MTRLEPGIRKIPKTKTQPSGHMMVVETTDPEGHRKVFKERFRGPRSLERARQRRHELKAQIASGQVWRELERQNAKIGHYVLTKYLPRIRKRNSENDAQQKGSASKAYLPYFGKMSIVDLRAHDIEQWVYDLEQSNSKNEELYAKATIVKYLQCFRTVVTEMCRKYNVRNPFDQLHLQPRQIQGRRRKRKVATIDELQKLVAGLEERAELARAEEKSVHTPHRPLRELMVRLMKVQLHTGCRTSEVLFLRKDHIDRDQLSITIEGGVVNGKPGPTKKGKLANDPEAGIRTIPVPPQVIDVMDEWLDVREDFGFPDTETLFTSEEGDYLSDDAVRRHYKKACEWVNSTPVTPHMLRHTLNDLLRRRGLESLARQALLGHSEEGTNRNYTNPRAEEARPHLLNVVELYPSDDATDSADEVNPTQNPTQRKNGSDGKN